MKKPSNFTLVLLASLCLSLTATRLLRAGEIHEAARRGKVDRVQAIVTTNASTVAEVDGQGLTPLWHAVDRRRSEVVSYLLDHGADPNFCNPEGTPVLFLAVERGRRETIDLLLQKDVKVTARDGNQQTVLHGAAYSGRVEIVTLLLDRGADVNAVDKFKMSPLQFAVYQPKQEMIDLLLARGANPSGMALCAAAEQGRSAAVTTFLQKGANPDLGNAEGETPLHLATRGGHLEIVQALLVSAKKIDQTESHYGQTPLHWAAIYGHPKIVAALQQKGANVAVKDTSGHTALDYAVQHGHAEVAALLAAKADAQPSVATAATVLAKPMSNGQAVVWYTGHSGWVVKTGQRLLIFDYYRPDQKPLTPGLVNGFINPAELRGLDITVFVSHEHGDHFDPAIFGWKDSGPNITYVYGFKPADTGRRRYTGPAYTFVGPQEQKEINGMKVAGLKSLDTGGGFLLQVNGLTIFHAGDHANLNAGTRADYDKEINHLATLTDHVDLAFLPVSGCPASWKRDQVIEGFFSAVTTLKAKTVFPMHGMQREWNYREFATLGKTRTPGTAILCAEFPGDMFRYEAGTKTAVSMKQ